MEQELRALIALQESDTLIASLEMELNALLPRLRDLERKRHDAVAAASAAEEEMKVEERRDHDIRARIAQHNVLLQRNTAQMDMVKNAREAGAATSQIDMTKRIIADDEAELRATAERIGTLRANVETRRDAVTLLDMELEAAHAEVAEQRTSVEERLGSARTAREERAAQVSKPMLGKYDRIRGKRVSALHQLRGQSCGNCDTAVPLHRRSQMASTGSIEICEGCGVLLYAANP